MTSRGHWQESSCCSRFCFWTDNQAGTLLALQIYVYYSNVW